MKECFLITTYCDTEKKVDVLLQCINNLKQYNIDIAIHAHYPLSLDIQKMVSYYFFSSQNPILSRFNYIYNYVNKYSLEMKIYDYAYSVMKLWKEGIGFLKHDYDVIHVVNYDVNLLPELYNLTMDKINKQNKSIFYTNYTNFNLVHVINFTILRKDIEYFLSCLDRDVFLEFTYPEFIPDGDTLWHSIEQYVSSILNDSFYKVSFNEWEPYIEKFLSNELNMLGYKNKQIKIDNGLYSQANSIFLFTEKNNYNIFIGEYNEKIAIMLFNIKDELLVEINSNSNLIITPSDYFLISTNELKTIKINNEVLDEKYIQKFFDLGSKILIE